MTIEALSILIYALLLFAVFATQATYAGITAGTAFGFSNRDDPQPGLGPFGSRVEKRSPTSGKAESSIFHSR